MMITLLQFLVIAAPIFQVITASDADPLQDFCVADLAKDLTLNGYPCKRAANTTTEDFIFSGLRNSANTSGPSRADAVFGFVHSYPGLNSLGLSIARLDFAPGGLIPPHTHPRGSEIIYVVEGSLYAGFVTTQNQLFAWVISKGDVMIFPRGLIHWQLNVGNTTAMAVVTLDSQSPGIQLIASSMFGSDILDEVLIKTFFIDENAVRQLKATFSGSS
ncbi:germin-like protein 1-3 isoform X2 [Selaginella moellendorffii]|uniref:germin-like protein 1-3 isoform X1 n=1 Tax=Selaginella moellendorffii TaxID=88036 RepID=UPI000D1C7B51|nr:germin-like protein 1-3 isoform X1 [Selaginella moellendorffii]XP_024531882.1 germin-like protein 1-3 isoform X2 [Selaginella moellendorffii]|eukprot:XP_024531881.1 germin-like protein 1-3 isoform X1 [Selaginella moellendorffii]